ncbi:inositol monophosphatase family protein [Microlunatus antarcticus]|uniref:Histidinol-phosphatase n=1 Tax=Microlunatus antarcticus TaxID=53388 RepID=A0A7W5P8K1_9ACTN|nr:inositol monophosphatase [Microlunatus antarcticus]MBB3327981.1 myo-inositol-1(or 4)-monophosphatase [Microlunatus antarcticus]
MAVAMSPGTSGGDDGLDARFAFGLDLVREAGELALRHFRSLSTLVVHRKGPRDVVSEADTEVEDLIRARLRETFPDDGFLGEETGSLEVDGSAGTWVVDPIDGTQPFVSGLRSWCVSIAYVRAGRVELGFVNSPAADELFVGRRGGEATLNGVRITPHPGTTLLDGLVYVGASPRVTAEQVVPMIDRLLRAGGMFVRSGSGALGLCDVACGRLLGYVEPHINTWDCLGAIAVLEAAGCRVDYGDATAELLHGGPIVAGPPAVFDQLVSLTG